LAVEQEAGDDERGGHPELRAADAASFQVSTALGLCGRIASKELAYEVNELRLEQHIRQDPARGSAVP
jgi:hypothetical protein